MLENIYISFHRVNKYPFFILFIGILGVTISSGGLAGIISLVGFLISLALEVILFGKLSNYLTKNIQQSVSKIFRENWLNYITIIIIISIPVLLLHQAKNIISLSGPEYLIFKMPLTILVAAISLYALPIAFLKKTSVIALIASIYYLLGNIKHSTPLLVFVVITNLVKFSPLLFIAQFYSMGLYGVIAAAIIASILSVYMSAIIFGAATLHLSANNIREQRA